MAKVCHNCGKGPAFGQSRSHSMVATKRRFDPNLQKVRILVGKAPRRVYVCTRCLKAGKVTKALEGRPSPPGCVSAAPYGVLSRSRAQHATRGWVGISSLPCFPSGTT